MLFFAFVSCSNKHRTLLERRLFRSTSPEVRRLLEGGVKKKDAFNGANTVII